MPVEIRVPKLGESIVEATISKWLKGEGDSVVAGEPLVELETDKVNLEVPADQAGVLSQILKKVGEAVRIGDLIALITEASLDSVSTQRAESSAAKQQEEVTASATPVIPATPVAQRVAEVNKLDLRDIQGSGPGGRVTKDDVFSLLPLSPKADETSVVKEAPSVALASVPAPAPAKPNALPLPLELPSFGDNRPSERMKMSRRRQTIARRLVEAQQSAAMLTTFNEVDLSEVINLRKRRKESFKERYGVGLGFMSFFTKATIAALKTFPLLNAEIDGEDIILKSFYDIGVAVGTEQGLVVPVLRDADRKTFAQIEQEIADLAKRARENKLTLADLQGGTFSITNGGVYGSLLSTPILNTPQVGILGMHKIEERPVAIQGQVQIRPLMYVALSYDHRLVDGSEAVRFLVRIKELVEDPESLLLEG